MVGLPDEELRFPFLNDRERIQSIRERVRAGMSACIGHPAVLCYVIGNEIPAPIVRWYGRRRIERILEQLCRVVKAEDPRSGTIAATQYMHTGSSNVAMVGPRHCWNENGRISIIQSAIFPGRDEFIVTGFCRRLFGAGGESITVLGAAHRSSPSINPLQEEFGRYLQCPSGTW
jgi:hypothetical protein